MPDSAIYELMVDFRNLSIEPGDILPAMQYPDGTAPEHILELIRSLLLQVPENSGIHAGYRILKPGYINTADHQISIDGITFLTGKTVTHYLKDSRFVAFILSTMGQSFDDWLHAAFSTGDPVSGFIIDAIGSEAVERVGDIVAQDIADRLTDPAWSITNQFSPGYCGWEVAEQQKLFSLFPENFCGVSLTDSSLMVPIKSISGMIGIGPGVRKVAYPCSLCTMTNCYKRRLPTREISK